MVSQKDLFEKIFVETDFKFDILIVAKFPFDPPGGVYKMRANFVN
ncbi:MAG: hypothetical protein U9N34_08520 [Candidatus Cloacimonadota bacterium]|nr:hypothetical protein [Candidatus Cloacimonadota bacterium]